MALRPEDGDRMLTGEAIQVDLAGLTDLAHAVRAENQRTLLPESETVRAGLQTGVCFGGRSASGYVYAAKERYQQSLIRASEQLTAYVRAAEILANAAEQVAKNYADTDALSSARMSDVAGALATAIAEAEQAALSPTPRGL